MLTYHVKKHKYYLSEVEITIEPNKQYNCTDCTIKFTPNSQEGSLPFSGIWWVTLDGCFDNAKDALKESTKEKYWGRGVSEAYD